MGSDKSPTKTFAIVIGSARSSRLGPVIADYVRDTLLANEPCPVAIEILDVREQNLPLFDEPTIPVHHPAADPTPHYVQEHTKAWSATVRRYDGFVFVTPQYNWSIPASLKNAIDYLYHEWSGKPAGIVSYGGHGGDKAAAHLQGVLTGLRMAQAPTTVALSIPREELEKFMRRGVNVDVPVVVSAWREAGHDEALRSMLREMIEPLQKE